MVEIIFRGGGGGALLVAVSFCVLGTNVPVPLLR